MPPGTQDAPHSAALDSSVWSLLAVNLIVLALALYQRWSLASFMLLYWSQSVIIGIANFLRILNLDKFSTDNFKINNKPVEPTPQIRRQTALFFAAHYGIFHAVYLGFIVSSARKEVLFTAAFALCACLFAVNHWWSYRYNRELDRQRTPNIGTLMFTPYVRILPMHATILSGALFAPTQAGLAIFGLLKTAADIAMHVVEQKVLKKVREA